MKSLAVFVSLCVGICVHSASIKDAADMTTEIITIGPITGITDIAPTVGPASQPTVSAATIPPASVATETAPTIQPITSTGSSPIITIIPIESTTSGAPTIRPAAPVSDSFDGASFGGGIALASQPSQPSGTTEHSMPSQETTEPFTGTTVTPGSSTGTSSRMTTNTKTSLSPRTKTSKAPTTRTTAAPKSKSFDGGSFGGGIALGFGLAIIMIVVYRCYVMRTNAKGKGYSGVE